MAATGRAGSGGWRTALRAVSPPLSRGPATLHAVQLLIAHGRNGAAELALRELLEREPDSPQALRCMAELLRRSGRRAEAVPFLRRLHERALDGRDLTAAEREAALRFRLAAEGCGAPPAAVPPVEVAAHFDAGAAVFDDLLVTSLRYRGPELLYEALTATMSASRALDVLDLGCGTGLAAPLFRPLAARLEGVDLSASMLARAHARGLYDALHEAELVGFLGGTSRSWDVVIAGDVFIYLGDLAPALAGCRRVVRAGGRVAFTVEAWGDAAGYTLHPTERYAHGSVYVQTVAERTGFRILSLDEAVVRLESTFPVAGWVCVLEPAGAADV